MVDDYSVFCRERGGAIVQNTHISVFREGGYHVLAGGQHQSALYQSCQEIHPARAY
jgi:hypothetical protein